MSKPSPNSYRRESPEIRQTGRAPVIDAHHATALTVIRDDRGVCPLVGGD